jgi:hypothetical protein
MQITCFAPGFREDCAAADDPKTDFFMAAAAPRRSDDMAYGEFRLNVDTLFCVPPCNHTVLKGLRFFSRGASPNLAPVRCAASPNLDHIAHVSPNLDLSPQVTHPLEKKSL